MTNAHRTCHRCKQSFAANAENFMRDKSRVMGLSYECRACHRQRKKGRDDRPDRWQKMTPEQRQIAKLRQQRYGRTDKGRAVHLRNAYAKIDACDMTTTEIYSLIVQPCIYCGTLDAPRGLDRIDNALPHLKTNVAPACAPCNFARGDRFSQIEMLRIGAVIREIMKDRSTKEAQSAGRQETTGLEF